jgi:hypothetical protein
MIYNMQTMVTTDSGSDLYIAIYWSQGVLSKTVAPERNAVQAGAELRGGLGGSRPILRLKKLPISIVAALYDTVAAHPDSP